ncbi:MAG: S-layer homology domain-containing protein, partial [Clostridiales bacterium]|nr:S-layer homology domain-containing protein [Clostridiales bacterium]
VTNGVCKGMSNEEFSPDKPITREQASLMISNYKKIADYNYDKINRFADKLEISDWAKSGVEGVLEKGYMNGYPDNTFKPQSNITRAEAVVTLSRVK